MGLFSKKPKNNVSVTVTSIVEDKPKRNSIFSKKPTGGSLPGDQPSPRGKGEKVTPEELRRLRELVRQRYAMDLEIWSLRKAGLHDRKIVEEKMKKADALLARIKGLVCSFDKREYFDSDADYMKFGEAKMRILKGGKREWMQNPPWNED